MSLPLDAPIQVAVIGAGQWGSNLIANFSKLGVLAGICDNSKERLTQCQTQYGSHLQTFDNLSPILESTIGCIAIATPAETHFEIAQKALLAGKDVYVEKPFTLRSSESKTLIELARAQNRILMVGHLLIYQPAIQKLKTLIDQGELGQLHSLHLERLNLGRVRKVENVLWSFGVHDLAVIQFLTQSPFKNENPIGQCALQPSIEDDIYLHLDTESGTKAHLHVSWLWPDRRRMLTAIGSKAMVVFDELKQTLTLHRKSVTSDLQILDDGSEIIFESQNNAPLHLELTHFLDCVKSRSTPMTDGISALPVVEIIEKVEAQLKTGGII